MVCTLQDGTYYNPEPHFGFALARDHSPQLWAVPVLPRSGANGANGSTGGASAGAGAGGGDGGDVLGPGLDEL